MRQLIKRHLQRVYAVAAEQQKARLDDLNQRMATFQAQIDNLGPRISSGYDDVATQIGVGMAHIAATLRPDEPNLPREYQNWREFYEQRHAHYAEILKELEDRSGGYDDWYRAGGYGYHPKQSRQWIINETSLTDYRGTCLDIGSGDGFWTWVLSEWFHVTGIDPVAGGVELANAIRKRLPLPIQRRTRFAVGDALEVTEPYDVIFCRAPSFFNYPIFKPFSMDMLDPDRKRLIEVWEKSNPPEVVAQKLAAYPKFTPNQSLAKHTYADGWRTYLDKMLSITRGMFIFILSTKPDYYGVYIGDTYNHDPAEVERLFAEYGASRVRMDSTNTFIVGEIYR